MRNYKLEPRSIEYQLFGYVEEKFFNAWIWMLALGIIHTQVTAVPALGYWLTLLLTFLIVDSGAMKYPVENLLNTKRTFVGGK